MAEPVQPVTQVFESSLLDLVSPSGRPKYVGAYQVSNQLVNALAHMLGQDGFYSRMLRCTANGILEVSVDNSASLQAAVAAGIVAGLVAYGGDAETDGAFYFSGMPIAEMIAGACSILGTMEFALAEVDNILYDVHDGTNHWLNVYMGT